MSSDISTQGGPQPPSAASDISEPAASDAATGVRPSRKTPIPGHLADAFSQYEKYVTGPSALDADSVRAYLSRVRQYLAWLGERWDDEPGGDPLAEPRARDGAVRDYCQHLLTVARRKPRTVNAHLDAINDFYRQRGLGPAKAKRQELPKNAPRALDDRTLIRFQRAAERSTARDRAVAFLHLYGGLRSGEVARLDVDDIPMSARKGKIIVRAGKGARYREVPMHAKLREVLETWTVERQSWPKAAENPALFLNERGGRLSTRSVYSVVVAIAEDAGIDVGADAEFTPHTLRHTAGTLMVRDGIDIVTVAEILGNSLEVARRYSLPTEDDKLTAIMSIPVDE